jgi:tripartite ATP-independent transporter DctM subunit
MDPIKIGIIGIIFMLILFVLRMPIAFAMAFTGWLGYSYLTNFSVGTKLLIRDFFSTFSSYNLSVITTFILMGTYAYASGIGQRLFKASYDVFGGLRGGLAITTIAAGAAFGAICGSSTAGAATMGKLAYQEMKRYGYDDSFSTGCIAVVGTLSILIPPSTVFIIYGLLTEQSIGKLYAAGIVPGIIMTAIFSIIIYIVCRIKPEWGPAGPPTNFLTKIKALGGVWEGVALFLVAIGGLFVGLFTPSQAGAVGAVGALVIGLLRRELTFRGFWDATVDGLRTASMILFLIAAATVFGHFIAITRIPAALADWIKGLGVSPWIIMIFIAIVYLIGGCFIDMIPLIVLTIPIFYPIILDLGFDPIWFGVLIVIVSQVGLISPPVGVNVYVVKGIAPEVPLERIFKGAVIIGIGAIITILLIFIFPELATWLPKYVKW